MRTAHLSPAAAGHGPLLVRPVATGCRPSSSARGHHEPPAARHPAYAEEVPPERRGEVLPVTDVQDCRVTAVFTDGSTAEVVAVATAWREGAVHVVFAHPDHGAPHRARLHRVWAPEGRVHPAQR